MLLPTHMIIVFTCNIKRLYVNIDYRLFLMTLAIAAWPKNIFQAAGAHGIKDDGTIDEVRVSSLFRVI